MAANANVVFVSVGSYTPMLLELANALVVKLLPGMLQMDNIRVLWP